jgi:hypothetical protein
MVSNRHNTMTEVRDEIWVLLARYLCGEATPSECLIVDILLSENEELKTFYQQMEMDYLINEKPENKDVINAFVKLDKRIKNSNQSGK